MARDRATSPARAALEALVAAAERAITPGGVIADEIPRQRASLRETAHRPWPPPARPWLMGQTWYDLLFAHWALPPEVVRPLVAEPLPLDERDGHAWLGITPFVVGGLRPHGVPPLPWLSRFPELNVRTYVDYGGRPGIYFFSLDAARLAAVVAARRSYRLPYFHAEMSAVREGSSVRYESFRKGSPDPRAEFRGRYGPAGPPLRNVDGTLEHWLTERYCLYVVDEGGRVLRGQIHHSPWPLHPARATIEVNTMAAPLGLELDSDPLLHYSPRQDVVIWALEPA
ncbi:MAG TPA: DUF2071 domain-containing protein [Thermoleophilaceae bacterium]|nr:DUF2071 domain-containing protein [Thermoleophilaceae bacterium]